MGKRLLAIEKNCNPDEDLWVETLLLINSFGPAIFSVRTSLLSFNRMSI